MGGKHVKDDKNVTCQEKEITFDDILQEFREEAFSEHDKGSRFERLMQIYLKNRDRCRHGNRNGRPPPRKDGYALMGCALRHEHACHGDSRG